MFDNQKIHTRGNKLLTFVLILALGVIAILTIGYSDISSEEDFYQSGIEEWTDSSALDPSDFSSDNLSISIAKDHKIQVAEEPQIRKASAVDSKAPLVAIIIDDFGPATNHSTIQGFVNLPFDITISIIPGNDRSVSIGKSALNAGKDVFVHLPMEPKSLESMDERDMIFADDDSSKIEMVFDRVFDELPHAVGINNHMGSRAMADTLFLKNLATILKKRDLIFVDSRTCREFLSLGIMRNIGVKATSRDVFLDEDNLTDNIEAQLAKVVRIARKHGWGVGIGHVKQETLDVLQKNMSIFESEGVEFVFVRDLINAL